jgi:hypothetical protein
MSADAGLPVQILDPVQLQPGDYIDARSRKNFHYRGCIQDIAPAPGLFWILESCSGIRKLIEFDEYDVWVLPAPVPVVGTSAFPIPLLLAADPQFLAGPQ